MSSCYQPVATLNVNRVAVRVDFYSDCEIYDFLLEDDFRRGRPGGGEPQRKKKRRESHKKEDAWAAKMGTNSGRVRNRVSQIGTCCRGSSGYSEW